MRASRDSNGRGRERERGVGIVAVLITVAVLGLLGGIVASVVARGTVTKTNDLVEEQSFGLVQAGFEYALKRIDDGADPDGELKTLGPGQFTVGYAPSGVITITSDVSAMYGDSNPSYTIQGPVPGGTMADCLDVDISGAYQHDYWWPDEIRGMVMNNTCNANITIGSMAISWNPNGGERTVRIRLGNSNVYNNWPGTLSGVPIDITDFTINSCDSENVTYLRFDTEMPDKNFTVDFTMTDGSTKSVFLQFVANNEAACLSVDLSTASIGGGGYTRLNNGVLTNNCAPPTVIEVTGLTVSWTPLSSLRFTAARFDTGWMWSGWVTSGTPVSFWGPVTIGAGDTEDQRFLEFSDDARGHNFTITYNMSDGTQHTVTKNLYESNMGACFQGNTGGTSIGGGGNRRLLGETWQNTCALGIVVDRVRTNWSGVPGNRRLQQIRVNGSNVWSGWVNSGTDVDINNAAIDGGGTIPVNRYRFNQNMTGGCFSHVMTFFDGTTASIPNFCP